MGCCPVGFNQKLLADALPDADLATAKLKASVYVGTKWHVLHGVM
jgi:hypothetical protein